MNNIYVNDFINFKNKFLSFEKYLNLEINSNFEKD